MAVRITGARRSGMRPHCVTYVFVFVGGVTVCRLYKVTLSDQAQVAVQLTVFLVSCKFFSRSARAVGKFFFSSRSPEPSLGGTDLNRGRQLFLAGAKHRGAVDNCFVPIRKFRCSYVGPEAGYPITFFPWLFFIL